MKVAVVLAGCGHLDGSEIRESVLALLALDKLGIEVQCFAPNTSSITTNHITSENEGQKRNVLEESARIARGSISDLSLLKEKDFSAIVLPGGYGAAKNLSDLAAKGKDTSVIESLKNILIDFWRAKKAIAAICISPAIIVAALRSHVAVTVTIGNDEDNLIESLGGKHVNCTANDYCIDKENNILSTPAYMLDASLSEIAKGIELMIQKMLHHI